MQTGPNNATQAHIFDVPYVDGALVGVPEGALPRELPVRAPLTALTPGGAPVRPGGAGEAEAALGGGGAAGGDDPRPDEHHGLPAHRQQLLLGLPLRVELAHVHPALELA